MQGSVAMNQSVPIVTTGAASASVAENCLSDFDLVARVRNLDGWVSPHGLAPRATFERLVAEGLLEALPGRPLYRVRAGGVP
jgi:hypothetical protein